MADTKISALTALTGASVAADDALPIVDTSVTMTKKIDASELKTYMSASPTLVTPTLGVATATSINKVALTTPATGSTLTIADGKTLTASNTLTFTGTDSSSVAFGAGGTVAYASGTPTSGQIATWTSANTLQGLTALPTTIVTKSANFTVQSTDQGSLISVSSGSAVACTLPQATGAFTTGWSVTIANYGAGATTITPTTSTINGSATLVLAQNDYAFIVSDGTNYTATVTHASSGSGVTIDSTAITSGTAGRVLFESATNKVSEDAGFSFDATNKALTVGGATVTASNPVLSLTQTWNNGAVVFKGISLNVTKTAASTLSGLLDLSIGGSTYFRAGEGGSGWSGVWIGAGITPSSSNFSVLVTGGTLRINSAETNGTVQFYFGNSNLGLSIDNGNDNTVPANVVVGSGALATTAANGFLYLASGAGTPTGTPSSYTGRVPLYVDTTNSQLWMYIGGAWKQPKTPAGAALVTWQ